MRPVPFSALLVLAPCTASAAGAGEGGFSFASSLVQMFGALAVVLGLIYVITHLSRRWLKGGFGFMGKNKPSYIRVVETRHLAPKQSLLLVEVAGEYLLLSTGAEGMRLIKQVDVPEEAQVLEVPGGEYFPVKGRFQDRFEGAMNRLQQPARMMTFETGNEL